MKTKLTLLALLLTTGCTSVRLIPTPPPTPWPTHVTITKVELRPASKEAITEVAMAAFYADMASIGVTFKPTAK